MKHGQKERTQVLLAPKQLAELRKFSGESGVPMAAIIRRGVALYLDVYAFKTIKITRKEAP